MACVRSSKTEFAIFFTEIDKFSKLLSLLLRFLALYMSDCFRFRAYHCLIDKHPLFLLDNFGTIKIGVLPLLVKILGES